jgi:phospholipid transport system substrate-binding protein
MPRGAHALMAVTLAVSAPAWAADTQAPQDPAKDPLALTRSVLERSNTIVRGSGDRKQKLGQLSDLLRGFLDTNALARLAAGANLDGRSAAETDEFLKLFHEFFVRTYVQRLLLFDAPDFAYGGEKVQGDQASVATEVITPGDRFAVDYTMHKNPEGWRATDIVVEGVSLAKNFRAQFDAAVKREGFQGLLDRLRAKVAAPAQGGGS